MPGRRTCQRYFKRMKAKNINVREFLKESRHSSTIARSIKLTCLGLSFDTCMHTNKGRKLMRWIQKTLLNYIKRQGNELAPFAGSFANFSKKLTSRNIVKHYRITAKFYNTHMDRIVSILDEIFAMAAIHSFQIGKKHLTYGYDNQYPLFRKAVRESFVICQDFFVKRMKKKPKTFSFIPLPNDWDEYTE